MDELEKVKLLVRAKVCDKYRLIYFGFGLGVFISDLSLYKTTGSLSGLSFIAIVAFAIALINQHLKDSAVKKLFEEGK